MLALFRDLMKSSLQKDELWAKATGGPHVCQLQRSACLQEASSQVRHRCDIQHKDGVHHQQGSVIVLQADQPPVQGVIGGACLV